MLVPYHTYKFQTNSGSLLMLFLIVSSLFVILSTISYQQEMTKSSELVLKQQANKLAQKIVIVDSHIDLPYRLTGNMVDISVRTKGGDFDYVRAKTGGLDAAFMSIYVSASYQKRGGGKAAADRLINMVEKFSQDWPDKFALVKSTEDIQKNFSAGLISLPMGMENGAPLEGKLENIKYFYDRGIRYITLAHSKSNDICDSSYDSERPWQGLSAFGKKVIVEMNRLGMMIDVSHVSDKAFDQVITLSKAPIIASHSSCRHFTPGWERNMSNDMIKALARNSGVIQINFSSSFLNNNYRKNVRKVWKRLAKKNISRISDEGRRLAQKYHKEFNLQYVDVTEVVAHIDHVVKLVGVDYVGLGSDFDGVGDSLPIGLKDVSYYPNLIYEFLKKGYSQKNIEKICSGNILRVWKNVEKIAQELEVDDDL